MKFRILDGRRLVGLLFNHGLHSGDRPNELKIAPRGFQIKGEHEFHGLACATKEYTK